MKAPRYFAIKNPEAIIIIVFGLFLMALVAGPENPPTLAPPTLEASANLYRLHREDVYTSAPASLHWPERERQASPRLQELNQKALTALERTASTAATTALSLAQAEAIVALTAGHPVVGLARERFYDHVGDVGFCFGRAAFIQMELERRGFNRDGLLKAFMVGKLVYAGRPWTFHVATLARGPEGTWWALDPLMGGPLPVRDWLERAREFDRHPATPTFRLYLTDATKLLPTSESFEGSAHLAGFNGYFEDLAKWFAENPVEPRDHL